MKNFTFYKDNRTDQKFHLNQDEIKIKFLEWLKSKDKSWLEYYLDKLAVDFVSSPDGLNSAMDTPDYQSLYDALNHTKWEYLNSIGIK